ncbi:acyltransferase domain-containing protein, partial [Streptomyces sp. NPDC005071]
RTFLGARRGRPRVPVVDTAGLDAEYWYDNLREKVLFETSVRRLADDGFRVFVEMSPHPVLTVPVQETVEDLDDTLVLSSSRRDCDEVRSLLGSLAQLHVRGGPVDWSAVFATRRRVDLPTYAFQRQRYWLSSSPTATATAELPAPAPDADDDRAVPLPERLAALTDDDARELVLEHVRQKVAVVLGHPTAEAVDPDQEFKELGFDSLLSAELSKRLTASTGLKLRANLVLRHPSPRRIAGHIVSSLAA